jgi:hypothetical protein
MRPVIVIFCLFIGGILSQMDEKLVSDVLGGISSFRSKTILYGSGRYEVVYNAFGGRVGQLASGPIFLSGSLNHTCIYVDTDIPIDSTTYPTKDLGALNSTSGYVNPLGLTINYTTGIGGANIFCTTGAILTTGKNYYAIYRLTTYLEVTGTNTTADICGVLGGDNTTCCANTECNSKGTCDPDVGCLCDPGYTGDFCEELDLGNTGCINGTFNATSGVCDCDDDFSGTDCSIPTCSFNGYWSAATDACRCVEGWGGAACNVCRTSPISDSTLTYVCFRTGNEANPYVLAALSSANLRDYAGNYITPGSTVARTGITYDCACDVEVVASAEHSSLSHHKGKKEKAKARKSHVKATKQVSALLASDESFRDLVNTLLEDLGTFSAEETAVFYGQLVQFIVGRDLARSTSALFLSFMMILFGIFVTIMTQSVAYHALGKQGVFAAKQGGVSTSKLS